jgi:glucose-1-phosphate thymidylyltransferase
MSRGYTWLDTGTHESLVEASQFVQTIEKRQGIKIACPEEIAFNRDWIKSGDIIKLAKPMMKNSYGKYLMDIIRES